MTLAVAIELLGTVVLVVGIVGGWLTVGALLVEWGASRRRGRG